MQTESKNESVLNPLVLPRHNQKKDPSKIPFVPSRYNPCQKKIKKTNPCKDSEKNRWYSVSVFWFKLCSRRLTERKAAILSSYIIRRTGRSLAIIRPVSLRLQDEGQKKLTDFTDAHGVFDTDFFDLCFFWCKRDYKRICKRERLRLLRRKIVL